jgi:hypothetical protein
MRFIVYPKEGKLFELDVPRFEFNEDGFKVYGTHNAATDFAFLSLENVAAIIPENQGQATGPILFHVHLKHREKPLDVFAHTFKTDEPPSVRFYWRFQTRDEEIKNTYVALSEVVAVVPADPEAVAW